MNWKFAGQAFFAGSSRSFRFKSSDSRSSSPLTDSESVAFSTCSNASLGSRYEVGRDVFSSVIRFFESTTLRSRSSDSRRSLLLAGSDSVAFSTCSKASSLGSRSGIIAICTNSDGLHRIIHADWCCACTVTADEYEKPQLVLIDCFGTPTRFSSHAHKGRVLP
jgi:hypothetical protein